MDPEEIVDTFCAITNASRVVAEHYLDAHNWDLNESVAYYMENPPAPDFEGVPPVVGAAYPAPAPAPAARATPPVDLTEDGDDDFQKALAASLRPGAHDDEDLERAMAESLGATAMDEDEASQLAVLAQQRQSSKAAAREREQDRATSTGATTSGAPPPSSNTAPSWLGGFELPNVSLIPDFLLGGMGAASSTGAGGSSSSAPAAGSRTAAGTSPNPPRPPPSAASGALLADRSSAAYHPHVLVEPPQGYPMPTSGYPNIAWGASSGAGGAAAASGSGAPSGSTGTAGATTNRYLPVPVINDLWDDGEPPEGVTQGDLEEARMLEAAMLGVPYVPSTYRSRSSAALGAAATAIGSMGAGPTPSVPRVSSAAEFQDPEMTEQREIRREQDQEYEESLRADRAKMEAAEKARREEAEAARRAREEAVLEGRRREESSQALTRLLASKAAALGAEPDASDTNAIKIMVRLSSGERVSRRFRRDDPLSLVFDFVDLSLKGAMLPGSYKLVTAYPRQVFESGDSSTTLLAAGFTADQALLMEGGTPAPVAPAP